VGRWNPATFDPKTGDGFKVVEQGVLTVREAARELDSLIATADVVVYETWRLYKTHAQVMVGNDMQPSQVVGMIRYVSWQHNKKVRNNGADIKGIAVKTMPEWLVTHMDKSTEQHDKDAIMHLWYYCWRAHYDGK
jgi:hypothetical protein